jgi:hypothetical protein
MGVVEWQIPGDIQDSQITCTCHPEKMRIHSLSVKKMMVFEITHLQKAFHNSPQHCIAMSYLSSHELLSTTPNDSLSPYDLDSLHAQQFLEFQGWPLLPESIDFEIPISLEDAPSAAPLPAQQVESTQAGVLPETRSRYKGVTPKSNNAKGKSRQRKKTASSSFVSNFERLLKRKQLTTILGLE